MHDRQQNADPSPDILINGVNEIADSLAGGSAETPSVAEMMSEPTGMPAPVAGPVTDPDRELPQGEIGSVFFADGPTFNYHNDPKKTAESQNTKGWSTLGDVGYLDKDGFLFLTDRTAFMIISGGVNIYPQEAENILITHPAVADVAVIGVPDEEFGEAVKAVVQPMDGVAGDDALADELLEYCRAQLAKIKCPKSVDFDPALPRHPTGKLYKRLVRDRYWGNKDSRIV